MLLRYLKDLSGTQAYEQNSILKENYEKISITMNEMSQNIKDIKMQASITQKRGNKMPLTFILKPKSIYKSNGIMGLFNKKIDKIVKLIWDEVCVYFYYS